MVQWLGNSLALFALSIMIAGFLLLNTQVVDAQDGATDSDPQLPRTEPGLPPGEGETGLPSAPSGNQDEDNPNCQGSLEGADTIRIGSPERYTLQAETFSPRTAIWGVNEPNLEISTNEGEGPPTQRSATIAGIHHSDDERITVIFNCNNGALGIASISVNVRAAPSESPDASGADRHPVLKEDLSPTSDCLIGTILFNPYANRRALDYRLTAPDKIPFYQLGAVYGFVIYDNPRVNGLCGDRVADDEPSLGAIDLNITEDDNDVKIDDEIFLVYEALLEPSAVPSLGDNNSRVSVVMRGVYDDSESLGAFGEGSDFGERRDPDPDASLNLGNPDCTSKSADIHGGNNLRRIGPHINLAPPPSLHGYMPSLLEPTIGEADPIPMHSTDDADLMVDDKMTIVNYSINQDHFRLAFCHYGKGYLRIYDQQKRAFISPRYEITSNPWAENVFNTPGGVRTGQILLALLAGGMAFSVGSGALGRCLLAFVGIIIGALALPILGFGSWFLAVIIVGIGVLMLMFILFMSGRSV